MNALHRLRDLAVPFCIVTLLNGAPIVPLGAQPMAAPLAGDRGRRDGPAPRIANASRTMRTPVIDGRDTDETWQAAQPVSEFRQTTPTEDGDPSQRTETRFAFDAANIYVLVRAYDNRPDSIVTRLGRRDTQVFSDLIRVSFDSYLDRRSSFNFTINPEGVQRDSYTSSDGQQEDLSWDGVWEAAAAIDSLGWVAEFRIPTSQLRFPPGDRHVFGVQVGRYIARYGERMTWPLERRSGVGIVTQFGELHGLEGLAAPRGFEMLPYVVAKNSTERVGQDNTHPSAMTGGFDAKLAVTSNLTLNATVNPDFGQVEADPAILNLSTVEFFLPERRPFFVEGAPLFRFDFGTGGNDQMFYSRRVARPPQLTSAYGADGAPVATRILGAAKLSGRFENGFSIAAMGARTARHEVRDGRTIEPAATFGIARVQQDWRRNQSMLGGAVTVMHRDLDEWSRDLLRRDAVVAGLDTRHRLYGGRLELTMSTAVSHVSGDSLAMLRTQRALTQNYQRTDGTLIVDPSLRELDGWMMNAVLRHNGRVFPWVVTARRFSPGFEPNDAGYLPRADWQRLGGAWSARLLRPWSMFRTANLNLNASVSSTVSDALMLANDVQLSSGGELRNFWFANILARVNNIGVAHDDRVSRGGDAVRLSPSRLLEAFVRTDARRSLIGGLVGFVGNGDQGRSGFEGGVAELTWRSPRAFELESALNVERIRNAWQFIEIADGAPRFARLDQRIVSLTTRFSWTLRPTLGVQVYAQPYLNGGTHSSLRALASPRAAQFADRFSLLDAPAPAGFTFGQFRSNAVMRWEYRPGSTLFVVWSQGRDHSNELLGSPAVSRDAGALFGEVPTNTFLVKLAYWFGR